MLLLTWIMHCLLMFLSVAFFIYFERKTISLFHNRVGPNKVSYLGYLQTLLDALKFFLKQTILPKNSNILLFTLSPLMGLLISCLLWLALPRFYFTLMCNYSFLFFFCLGSIMVLSVLAAGWASNSKYSLIGSLRSVAQSISYESVLRVCIMLFIILVNSYSIQRTNSLQRFVFSFLLPLWVICTLAETHRAPFDFRESESELVSGYNTEYSSVNFAFVLLSEYLVLLFSCMMISYIFFIAKGIRALVVGALVLLFVVTWVRITFCRFRYDKLIAISWKTLLPFSLLLYLLIWRFSQ